MLIWQWGLVALSVCLLLIFAFVLVRYLKLKKMLKSNDANDQSTSPQQLNNSRDASKAEKRQWLALLEQQRVICRQLLSEIPASDFQGKAALSCWAIFLDVEIQIIQNAVPNAKVIELLGAFKKLLAKVDRAQEIDALMKSLKVNQTLLRELNKVIQKTGEKVFTQVNITSELNLQLDKLQTELDKEAELDDSLAVLRSEIASMYEFAERLKQHLADVKEEGDNEHYIDALEAFLNSTDEMDFVNSVKSELDYKVEDLKQLAAYQKSIIADLKEQIRQVKVEHQGDDRHIGEYDISIVRLEKALLESGKVVKRLEKKLESLQAIKYNLNIDMIKRDEALKQKKALLEKQREGSAQSIDIYGVMEEERNTMKNMEDLLHQESFTEETNAFANEQASKLNSLRLMVNESELYVEMLERDLEKAHSLREKLEFTLQHPETIDQMDVAEEILSSKDQEEIDNLEEINIELEEERKRLQAEVFDHQDQLDEFEVLQAKVDELDEKIEVVQKNYVDMEERYLAALMAKEEKM